MKVLCFLHRALCTENMPYDRVMVSNWLYFQNLLDDGDGDGDSYLNQLFVDSPTSLFNLSAYAEKIHKYAVLRDLISASNDLLDIAYAANELTLEYVLESVQKKILEMNESFLFLQENEIPNNPDVVYGVYIKI